MAARPAFPGHVVAVDWSGARAHRAQVDAIRLAVVRDGSNWELLCTYCHENEHQRFLTEQGRDPESPGAAAAEPATHQPFANLKAMIKTKDSG